MNAIDTALKGLACALGALAITAAMSWSFVQSTSAAPAIAVVRVASLPTPQRHVWFGQSRPAVLVD